MKPNVKLKPKQAKAAEVRLLPAVIAVGIILFGGGVYFHCHLADVDQYFRIIGGAVHHVHRYL